jgi:2-keto-4-pentenoate hydratase/2-oxohepta-3-ene-1,7-dioic acid hydratase in catechol pathway
MRIAAGGYSPTAELAPVTGEFGAPVPRPRQAFGAGLNYADHAGEAGLELPIAPLIFAKYASCIRGPADPLVVGTDSIDWEVELVVAIGARSRHVPAGQAWAAVAGLTIGQDISDRTLQWSGGATPQFSLGKSGPGFGPVGPVLVTPDELADGDELVSAIEGIGEFTTQVAGT